MNETNHEFGQYQEIIDNAMDRDSLAGPTIEKITKKFFKDQKEQEKIYNCLKEKIEKIIADKKAGDKSLDKEDESYIQTVIAISEQISAKKALNQTAIGTELEIKFRDLVQEIKNYQLK